MKQNNNILYFLLVIILILTVIIIFRKPTTVTPEPFDDSSLRHELAVKDSIIQIYMTQSIYFQNLADKALAKSDSLESLKDQIYEDFNKQYDFNVHATNQQLDSVIRANW